MDSQHFSLALPRTTAVARRPRGMARRIALGALAVVLIAMTAIPAFADRPSQERHDSRHTQQQKQDVGASGKRKRNKIVTKTFTSDGTIDIPAAGSFDDVGPANPYPSAITVKGFKKSKITDVNLTLRGLSHSFPADIDLLLVAPGGRNVVVMDEVGRDAVEDGVTDIIVTLDDEAARVLPSDNALTSGSFRPVIDDPDLLDFPVPAPAPSGKSALSTFDGIDPNGAWQLFIVDDGNQDTGSLADGWSLQIAAKSKAKSKAKNTGKKQRGR